MPDHIHMLLSILPKMSVGEFMGYLKGKSTLMIFERHVNLKYKYGRRVFWAKEYYVSTVGGNKKAIQKYIQDQVPGEVVQIIDGYIYIDGQRLEADNGLDRVVLAGLAENPVTLGEGEYFLLGDNRDGSEDSRFANIGNVNRNQIRGKIWMRLLPLIHIGLVE